MTGFKRFVKDYLLCGIICGLVAVGIVFLLSCLVILISNQESDTKQNLNSEDANLDTPVSAGSTVVLSKRVSNG